MADRVLLLVEGKDDEHVLGHICSKRDISPTVAIRPYGNYEQLLSSLDTDLRFGEPNEAYGVIVDADWDVSARWQAVLHRLRLAGYHNLPALPDPAGSIIEPPQDSVLPRTGVWIMPDNQAPGKLEDFLRFMIPDGDKLLSHAQACLDSLDTPPFRDVDRPKALIHTWLAWQRKPGRPYGTAIEVGSLNAGVPQVDALVDWLERLFTS